MISASIDVSRTTVTVTMNRDVHGSSLGATDFSVGGVSPTGHTEKNGIITLSFAEPFPLGDLPVRVFGDGTSNGSPNGVRDLSDPAVWTIEHVLPIPAGALHDVALSYSYVDSEPHFTVSGTLEEGVSITHALLIQRTNFGEVGSPFTVSTSFSEIGAGDFSVTLPYPTIENLNQTSTTNVRIRLLVTNTEGGSAFFQSASLSVLDIPPPTVVPEEVVDPCVEETCVSNILFLPGVKGSRLYMANEGCGEVVCEDRLWEPGEGSILKVFPKNSFTKDIQELYLNSDGTSVRSDIYVKKDDIITEAYGKKYYLSFVNEFNFLRSNGIINDWEAVPYDWRLSLFDIVTKGFEVEEGVISYSTATNTPYIAQTLRRLAETSQTGKVTIVAHSNGGLVTKALLSHLGEEETKALVDAIVFVGVPQDGAPRAIGTLLYGYEEGISKWGKDIISAGVARTLAENSPAAYHLLPSQKYFDVVRDAYHPLGSFVEGGQAYVKEREAYGFAITNWNELSDFLLAREGGRVKPGTSDAHLANILNETLVSYGKTVHDTLGAWLPSEGVTLYQIAGWGVDTLAGIEFFEIPKAPLSLIKNTRGYRPVFTEDGDEVVPVPSALSISVSTPHVYRHFVNLPRLSELEDFTVTHENLFEAQNIIALIKGVMFGEGVSTSDVVTSEQVVSHDTKKKLRFFLHSPLTLGIYDSAGNYTGALEDGDISEGIPGVTYGRFGEVQYLIAPSGENYQLSLQGLADGEFTLQIEEVSGEGSVLSTIANVPSTASTLATLMIGVEGNLLSSLQLDYEGDGVVDEHLNIPFGDTLVYEETLEEESAVEVEVEVENLSISGGGGSGSRVHTSVESETLVPIILAEAESNILPEEIFVETLSAPTENPVISETVTSTKRADDVEIEAVTPPSLDELEKENVPQTASVYDAFSQHGIVEKFLSGLYNIFIHVWSFLKTNTSKLFFW